MTLSLIELNKKFEFDNNGYLIYKNHFHKSKNGSKAGRFNTKHNRSQVLINQRYYREDQIVYFLHNKQFAKYIYNVDGDRKNNSFLNLINLKTLENKFDESQKMLKERIIYDPETGVVKWKAQKDTCNIGNPVLGEDAHGYKIINIDYKVYKLHSMIWLYMTGETPNIVDHLDYNRRNNIFKNLKNGTYQDNSKNLSKSVSNTSGVTGINIKQSKYGEKYLASITVNNKRIHLGCFDLIDDAISSRKDAEVKYNFNINHGQEKVIETSWRSSREYRIWRISCIRRDSTCQICNSLQSRQVHHLNNAEDHPEQRFNIDNGVTLCRKCHTQYHCNYHRSFREKTTKYDWENFKTLTSYFKEVFTTKIG